MFLLDLYSAQMGLQGPFVRPPAGALLHLLSIQHATVRQRRGRRDGFRILCLPPDTCVGVWTRRREVGAKVTDYCTRAPGSSCGRSRKPKGRIRRGTPVELRKRSVSPPRCPKWTQVVELSRHEGRWCIVVEALSDTRTCSTFVAFAGLRVRLTKPQKAANANMC